METSRIRAEMAEVKGLLERLPRDDAIGRVGLERRLDELTAELERQPPSALDVRELADHEERVLAERYRAATGRDPDPVLVQTIAEVRAREYEHVEMLRALMERQMTLQRQLRDQAVIADRTRSILPLVGGLGAALFGAALALVSQTVAGVVAAVFGGTMLVLGSVLLFWRRTHASASETDEASADGLIGTASTS